MKDNNVFYFLLVFILISITSSAQWAPIGSSWHTGIIESFSSSNQGYIATNSIGDSVINFKNCKLMQSTHVNSSGQVTIVDTAFMYTDSGRVYDYKYGSFYLLYDFSLNQGGVWQTIAPYPSPFTLSGNPPDTIVNILVDSVSYRTISGISKKIMYVHSISNDWYFLNPIIEDIGSSGGLYPFIYDWSDFEIPLLRCYNDSNIQYQVDPNFSCDSILNEVNDSKTEVLNEIRVFPNPASDFIFFNLHRKDEVKYFLIYNELGVLTHIGNSEEIVNGIFVGDYSSGMYCIVFFFNAKTKATNFIISHNN